MKLKEEEMKTFLCPFCGAPQRRIIPLGTMQVKCLYCSGVILVPPWMGGETLRCVNHFERLAVGICNDCGRNFCGECLHIYHLETRDTRVILYLDPTCLRKRYVEKANNVILFGAVLIVFGIFSIYLSLMFSIFLIICGIGIIAYGISKSKETPTELTVDKALMERKRTEADIELKEIANAEKVYSQLLTKYVSHWGVRTGTDLLQNEIRAYIRLGVSFSEAVKKIYARQRER